MLMIIVMMMMMTMIIMKAKIVKVVKVMKVKVVKTTSRLMEQNLESAPMHRKTCSSDGFPWEFAVILNGSGESMD